MTAGSLPALTLASLANRRATALLTILAIAVSVMLLLGVEKVRTEAKASFANTISGTDLIVGARGGEIPLLLYSVFRIGNATNNISWESYREIAAHPRVAWTIPLSLGDSFRGFRVLGTSAAYFRHYRFGRERALSFAAGRPFDDVFDAVLGADVAAEHDYALGDEIVVAHGLGEIGLARHDDKPFRVVGILARTGTPVDRTVHVGLAGIEAIHVDWRGGRRLPGVSFDADQVRGMTLEPEAITAFMVGLDSRFATFEVQRLVNEYPEEPLLAILPGVVLQQLWSLMGTAERALSVVTAFVVATGFVCMLSMLLAGLNERRREMAVLRAVGAAPRHVFGLLLGEAVLLTLVGTALGLGLLYAGLMIAQPLIKDAYGLAIVITAPTGRDLTLIGLVLLAGALSGTVPAWRAYRTSLADGISVRL